MKEMVNSKSMTVMQSGLVWFGAGVSIAEILTGTYFAPLGMTKGLLAILLGHLIGGGLMFLAGMIGARTGRSAMETVKMSFGGKGGQFFALMNVLQLVGWTAIMIYDGAAATNEIFRIGAWIWALVIGLLILIWILVGLTKLGALNYISMGALFLLTLVLSAVIFRDAGSAAAAGAGEALHFGAAVELAAAMPLSWLPLISDYTREAKKPVAATLTSVLVYGAVSCWMYVIGMGAAIFTGEYDIASVMAKAGLGIAALAILILSTVTTTFLDAWSAGISSESLRAGIKGKTAAALVAAAGTVLAMLFNMDNITNFLYLIGSVFAPMIAVQIADFFILHRDRGEEKFAVRNIVIWMIGFTLYRILMRMDTPVGSSAPDIAVTVALCVAADKLFKRTGDRSGS